jgi:Zn-dependent protease
MLQSLLSGGDPKSIFVSLLLRLPIVLLALTVHECAHGYVAFRLGDPTARNLGRLTLNPIKHLNPFGFLCMLLVGFGWANPVPINPRNFRDPRKGMALSAIAGPISNLLLGLFFVLLHEIAEASVYRMLLDGLLPLTEASLNFFSLLLLFLELGAWMNVCLAVFNLIPVPPFDGSRFLYMFLPPRAYFGIMRYENYIMIGSMLLLIAGVLDTPLRLGTEFVLNGMYRLVDLLPFLG